MLETHYRKHYKKLAQKAGRILQDHHYGEDATQEAYEVASKYLGSFDPTKGKFDQWFSRIYSNTMARYINFIRDKGITKELRILEVEVPLPTLFEENVGLIEKEINLYGGDTIQEILTLFIIKGYTSCEVGMIMDMSQNAVSKTVFRFKIFLREKYAE